MDVGSISCRRMKKNKEALPLFLCMAFFAMLVLNSCSVGPDSYEEPWVIDGEFEYCVVYDAMGGSIKSAGSRTVYYSADSLLKEPSGASGMLVEPVNGNKLVFGWYTAYKNTGTEEQPVYVFDEEDRWDFASDRINDENAGRDKTLTLYAYWIDAPSVYFVDADDAENILIKWENIKLDTPLSRPTSTEKATIKKTVGGIERIYSLLDYYFDPECSEKVVWGDSGSTVGDILSDSQGEFKAYIYCKYIEGEYTRIRNAAGLRNISDLDGKYIIADDIDLDDVSWQPIGEDKPFGGVLLGNGYTISNLRIEAKNRVTGISPYRDRERSFGLFSSFSGAIVSGVSVRNATIVIDSTCNAAVCAGVLGGRARDSVFENCKTENYKVYSNGEVKIQLFLGAAIFADNTCILTKNDFEEPDTDALSIIKEKLITGLIQVTQN